MRALVIDTLVWTTIPFAFGFLIGLLARKTPLVWLATPIFGLILASILFLLPSASAPSGLANSITWIAELKSNIDSFLLVLSLVFVLLLAGFLCLWIGAGILAARELLDHLQERSAKNSTSS